MANCGFGQESIRPSYAGSLSSEARKPAANTAGAFLKAGPVDFSASASVSLEYNDNIGLAEKDRQSDLIIRPEIEIDSTWHVTALNTLRFNIGIAYAKYTQHGDLDTRSLLLDPGSQISFDVFIGGVLKLTFHDRFAILQNPIDEPTLSNTARFDRFQNAAGLTALFDFNDLKIVLGYDHFNYSSLSNDFDFLDRREEQFSASASLQLSDAVIVGVDGSAGIFKYRTGFNNDGTTWSAGPFVEATLSNYTTLRLSGGYQAMNFDQGGLSGDTTNSGGWYGSVTVAQRLNQYWSHSLSAGHESRLGLEVNFFEYTYARYLAQWQINPRLSASIDVFAESANESGTVAAQNSEDSFRWGGGVTLAWRLGNKLTVDLGYGYVNKNSDLLLRDYYQNVGTLAVKYDF
ncbi:MAG: outer membrane beta-barrel protein [Chthoniobacter sp.]|nr:outer membrane beta-barrel protein [Chthoniobacter sp.]